MSAIWSKPGQRGADEAIQQFLAGEDVRLDRHLFLFDIDATRAHTRGLNRIGIINDVEMSALEPALDRLADDYASGAYRLGPPFEDGHSAIEAWLTEQCGDVGKRIHTGRSRNDQVQTALRLYLRDRLNRLERVAADIACAALDRAEEMHDWPMPGYTHLQRAVPSTVGHWLAGFAEAFTDNAELAGMTRDWLNTSPLGTAAGYGVNLPLDREFTGQQLAFSRLQLNPQYAQNSRGRFELQALTALAQNTLELRRLAWDLSLFSSAEFALVQFDDRYTTGSSIMPNKRNPDVVELLRARHAVVAGAMVELQEVLSLPSGYQRDLQATKPPLIRAFEQGLAALELLPDLMRSMQVDGQRARSMIDSDMFATDLAVDAARDGIPFRDAYRAAMSNLDSSLDPEKSIRDRVSPGGCARLGLKSLRVRLQSLAGET